MRDAALEQALSEFLAAPGNGVDRLMDACGPFVLGQARLWQRSRMPFIDRCREILTEIVLILLEDIRPDRAAQPASVLAYLSLRLRRITRPYPSKATPFGLSGDLPDRGRCDFTPMRLDLVRELTGYTRSALLNDPHEATRSIEFLFIHIAPDLAAASRFLAIAGGTDPEARVEADKKRHQAFTRQLRRQFEALESGDWRDVANWSGGERSHLAWRLISFTHIERAKLGDPLATALESWRDAPQPYRSETSRAGLILPAIESLAGMYPPLRVTERPAGHLVAEPAAPYGAAEEVDPLAQLLMPGSARTQIRSLRQDADEYGSAPVETLAESDDESVEAAARAYLEAVKSVRSWFEKVSRGLKKS